MSRRGTYTVPQRQNSKDKGEDEDEEEEEELGAGNNTMKSINGTASCCFSKGINFHSVSYLIVEAIPTYSRKYRYSFGQLPAWAKRQVSIILVFRIKHFSIYNIVILLVNHLY